MIPINYQIIYFNFIFAVLYMRSTLPCALLWRLPYVTVHVLPRARSLLCCCCDVPVTGALPNMCCMCYAAVRFRAPGPAAVRLLLLLPCASCAWHYVRIKSEK